MIPYDTVRSRLLSLIASVATWAAALVIAMSIGGLWFFLPARSLWALWLLAVPLALIVVVVLWRHFRFRAARRFRALLDAYADREICRDHWK